MVSPPERRGSALAFALGGLTLSSAIGLPLGTLIGRSDWHLTLWAVAGLGLVAALIDSHFSMCAEVTHLMPSAPKNGITALLSIVRYCLTLLFSTPLVVAHRSKTATSGSPSVELVPF
ncbi:hypothetical protein SALBM311S_08313 [Streptomyces alboniger]